MNVSLEVLFHIGELIFLGLPVWWGVFRLFNIAKDFPPHRHGVDVRDISYPRGYDPPETVRLKSGTNGGT